MAYVLICFVVCSIFLLLRGSTSSKQSISSPRRGNLGNLGWECVAGTLKPLAVRIFLEELLG